ncbi:ATP-binding protein [Halobacteriovorax sp. ZH4_bin.1]|uniref:ATP-binding protein n=1 Tax=unclassified Halobacteriovorax TaxID=2639665 RepID=UPI00371E586C
MKDKVIGKVVKINTGSIEAELLEGAESHVVNSFEDIYEHSLLESYLGVRVGSDIVIGEVVGLKERDSSPSVQKNESFSNAKSKVAKYIEIAPVGTLSVFPEKEFEFGVSKYPQIYADVIFVGKEELDIIFDVNSAEEYFADSKNTKLNYLSVGRSTTFKNYEVKIELNKFFGSHSAVLGNTGSGKSCTISSVLQNLFKKTSFSPLGASFIIFDVNGEYSDALDYLNSEYDKKVVTVSSLEPKEGEELFVLPHWFLSFDEWALLLKASDKSQKPILRLALGMSGLLEGEEEGTEKLVAHLLASCIKGAWLNSMSPVSTAQVMKVLLSKFGNSLLDHTILTKFKFNSQYGNFPDGNDQKFLDELESFVLPNVEIPAYSNKPFAFNNMEKYLEFAILYEEAHGNKQIRDYCSQMLTRFKALKDYEEFEFLRGDLESFISKEEYCNKMLGLSETKDGLVKTSQFTILDLNAAEDDVVEISTAVISRMIFERLRKAENRNKFPVNFVLEEAHRYISVNSGIDFEARKIFERIAKEGRKFGLFILLSSQRPSELSKTVLSQCSSFIVHRIMNPDDLIHIRKIAPSASDVIINRLVSLPTRHALVFGAASKLPAIFKVNRADPLPKSDNNKVSDNWFVEEGKKIKL